MKKETSLVLAALAGGSLLLTPLQGQGLHLKGQLWGSFTYGNDPAPGRENVEETIGYIPTLSLGRQFGPLSVLDLEAAYQLGAVLDGALKDGEDDIDRYGNLYRLWGRFASERFELRVGLQKIAFGPGRVLRPLMWFDTLDLRDPTGQTEGVGALRLKWYPWHNLALWGWIIRPDYREFASPGGRVEVTLGPTEVALAYHRHKASSLDYAGQMLLPSASPGIFPFTGDVDEEEERFAFDARWDGFVGLWTEMVLARATEPAHDDKKNQFIQMMIGGDYTFPWGDGVYVMVEHLYSQSDYVAWNEPWPPS